MVSDRADFCIVGQIGNYLSGYRIQVGSVLGERSDRIDNKACDLVTGIVSCDMNLWSS